MNKYLAYIGLGLAGLVLVPAVVAGGGFILAIGAAVFILLLFIGGPELANRIYDFRKAKYMGAGGSSSASIRDLIDPDGNGPDERVGGKRKQARDSGDHERWRR
jgi:hypothetical protein